jgi:methylmalonyl-CoA/ethylmalonyl-CoA epimerase
MEANIAKNAGAQFTQIAWVVKDVNAAMKFYREVMGIDKFGEPQRIRFKEYEATYYGKPSDGETLTALAYSGGTFIEIIQPLSGKSIFHDYLAKNPAGGIQHVAYSIPVAGLDKVISEFAEKGFGVVSRFNTPPAQIVFFDTYKEIGVMTEIMGITKEGEAMVEKMKTR